MPIMSTGVEDQTFLLTLLTAVFAAIFASYAVVICGDKKKKNTVKKTDSKNGSSMGPSASKPAPEPEKDPESLKPRSMIPQNQEELEAVTKIRQGKTRAAKDNETVEDAASDWGAVKSMGEKESGSDKKKKKK